MREVFILEALRTPRGKGSKRGSLASVRPVELVARLLDTARDRVGFNTDEVEDVVLGCVTQVGDQGANIAKIAALYAGWDERVPGMTVNRFCASGLEAVNIAAAKVASGAADMIVAGGVESMSRVGVFDDRGAWFSDEDVASRVDYIHMGIAADLVANLSGFQREELDAVAVESHRRAAAAIDAGTMPRSLVPVIDAEGHELLATDECLRRGVTAERLAEFAPAFGELAAAGGEEIARKHCPALGEFLPLHHAGTSPALADGASLLLLASKEKAQRLGCSPLARIRAGAAASVDPVVMLTGNVDCTRKALAAAALPLDAVGQFEVNESFAAVPLHFQRELSLDPTVVNPCGGAIALGHPLGATGGVLIATLIDRLAETDSGIGVATICGGAGVASSTVVERL